MRYEFKPSFDRLLRKLPKDRQQRAQKAVNTLIDFFETGSRTKGLGLKQLRGNFWELRAGLKDRIIFQLELDKVSFLTIGNHDEIRRYLKQL